jgi:hypothetical protein
MEWKGKEREGMGGRGEERNGTEGKGREGEREEWTGVGMANDGWSKELTVTWWACARMAWTEVGELPLERARGHAACEDMRGQLAPLRVWGGAGNGWVGR